MTAASIGGTSAQGYVDYLESRTGAPERGDYYLGTDGTPAESPGQWLTSSESLARLGIEPGEVDAGDLRALMEGRVPGSPAGRSHAGSAAGLPGTRPSISARRSLASTSPGSTPSRASDSLEVSHCPGDSAGAPSVPR